MYVTSTNSGAISLYGLLCEKFGEQGLVMCTRLALPLIVQELPQLYGTIQLQHMQIGHNICTFLIFHFTFIVELSLTVMLYIEVG